MLKKHVFKFFSDKNGFGVIEASILMPIMIVIVFGVIEFGNYYMKQFSAQRAVSIMSNMIQTYDNKGVYPASCNQGTCAGTLRTEFGGLLRNGSLDVFSTQISNNTCYQRFLNSASAKAYVDATTSVSGGCSQDLNRAGWDVSRVGYSSPSPLPDTTPYYVGLVVKVPYQPITALPSLAGITFPDRITASAVVSVSSNTPSSPTGTCTPSQYVTYDSATNSFTCSNFPPYAPIPTNCTGSNQALHWNGSAFLCETLDYQPTIDNCSDTAINGLQWDGSKYNCVVLPKNPSDQCNTNTVSSAGNGSAQFVQWNGTDYTCTSINQTDLKGKDGTDGTNGKTTAQIASAGGTGSLAVFLSDASTLATSSSVGISDQYYCMLTEISLVANSTATCSLELVSTINGWNNWKLTAKRAKASDGAATCRSTCYQIILH